MKYLKATLIVFILALIFSVTSAVAAPKSQGITNIDLPAGVGENIVDLNKVVSKTDNNRQMYWSAGTTDAMNNKVDVSVRTKKNWCSRTMGSIFCKSD